MDELFQINLKYELGSHVRMLRPQSYIRLLARCLSNFMPLTRNGIEIISWFQLHSSNGVCTGTVAMQVRWAVFGWKLQCKFWIYIYSWIGFMLGIAIFYAQTQQYQQQQHYPHQHKPVPFECLDSTKNSIDCVKQREHNIPMQSPARSVTGSLMCPSWFLHIHTFSSCIMFFIQLTLDCRNEYHAKCQALGWWFMRLSFIVFYHPTKNLVLNFSTFLN